MGHSEKKKAKKEKQVQEEVVETMEPKHKKEKKDKKVKKDKKDKKDKTHKESKAKKDKKRKRESDTESEPVEESKPRKKAQEVPSAAVFEETASGGWNDWTKASFGGDDAQKNKFLRLLGAKKTGNMTSTSTEAGSSHQSAIDDNVNQKMNQDLEKQFQDGLKMRKQQYGGKKGGLGWS